RSALSIDTASSVWITVWISIYRYRSRPSPFFPGPGPASRRTPPSHPLRASTPSRLYIRIVDRNSKYLIYKEIIFRVLTIISGHLARYRPAILGKSLMDRPGEA